MNYQKVNWLDSLLDLILLSVCLLATIAYWESSLLLKGLAFGGCALLMMWNLVDGIRLTIHPDTSVRLGIYIVTRPFRIIVGCVLLMTISKDLSHTMPILDTAVRIGWLGMTAGAGWFGVSWYDRSRQQALEAKKRKQERKPERKPTAVDLKPGQIYHVIKAFHDYDGLSHPVGERWRFLKKGFLPAEDGLTLIVEKDGQEVWIRLQWRAETQAEIIDDFFEYVSET